MVKEGMSSSSQVQPPSIQSKVDDKLAQIDASIVNEGNLLSNDLSSIRLPDTQSPNADMAVDGRLDRDASPYERRRVRKVTTQPCTGCCGSASPSDCKDCMSAIQSHVKLCSDPECPLKKVVDGFVAKVEQFEQAVAAEKDAVVRELQQRQNELASEGGDSSRSTRVPVQATDVPTKAMMQGQERQSQPDAAPLAQKRRDGGKEGMKASQDDLKTAAVGD